MHSGGATSTNEDMTAQFANVTNASLLALMRADVERPRTSPVGHTSGGSSEPSQEEA